MNEKWKMKLEGKFVFILRLVLSFFFLKPNHCFGHLHFVFYFYFVQRNGKKDDLKSTAIFNFCKIN